jgi:hypothetical protein
MSREIIYFIPKSCIFYPSWPWHLTFWNFRCPYITSRVSLYTCAKFDSDLSINSGEMIYFMPKNCIIDPFVTLTFDLRPFRCPHITSRVLVYACTKFVGDLPIKSGEMFYFMPENCSFDPSWPWPLTSWYNLKLKPHMTPINSNQLWWETIPIELRYCQFCDRNFHFFTSGDIDLWPLTSWRNLNETVCHPDKSKQLW